MTVGAATLAKRNNNDQQDRAARATAVAPAPAPPVVEEDPVAAPPETPVVERPKKDRPDRGRHEGRDEPVEEEPLPVVPPIDDGTDETEPDPGTTPDPSGGPSPDPGPTVVPPPAWSFDFITSTTSVEICACDGSSATTAPRVDRTGEDSFTFSQGIRGGASDSEGDLAWPFSLLQWGQVGPEGGRIEYRFGLTSVAGLFRYQGVGSLAETVRNEDGSALYRFEGTFELVDSSAAPAPGLPIRGFVSIRIGVWQDGTIYVGSFTLQDASG